ncbi:hypothetical protein EFP25_12130, partial [Lactiplantibacillus pentosus]|uniref:hypothetical protein n=1 Tax=Lactiplantibacillus pentosus TaxID=1589 RepID=UPI0021A6A06A
SYTGLQEFLTTLERDGHRFKPKARVLNTGLPLNKHKTLAKWNFIAEHCQKHLPAGDFIRKADMCEFNFLANWSLILRNQLFWYLTVRLVSDNR